MGACVILAMLKQTRDGEHILYARAERVKLRAAFLQAELFLDWEKAVVADILYSLIHRYYPTASSARVAARFAECCPPIQSHHQAHLASMSLRLSSMNWYRLTPTLRGKARGSPMLRYTCKTHLHDDRELFMMAEGFKTKTGAQELAACCLNGHSLVFAALHKVGVNDEDGEDVSGT